MASKRWKTIQEFMNEPENKERKERSEWKVEAMFANLDRLNVHEIVGFSGGFTSEYYRNSDFNSAYNPMLSDKLFVSSIPFDLHN